MAFPIEGDRAAADRGVVDALALVFEQDGLSPVEVEAHISEFPYNKIVFVFPPWEDIYRTDAERDQTFPESIQVYERLSRWYAQWKYQPVKVPTIDIDARVDFILRTVDKTLTQL